MLEARHQVDRLIRDAPNHNSFAGTAAHGQGDKPSPACGRAFKRRNTEPNLFSTMAPPDGNPQDAFLNGACARRSSSNHGASAGARTPHRSKALSFGDVEGAPTDGLLLEELRAPAPSGLRSSAPATTAATTAATKAATKAATAPAAAPASTPAAAPASLLSLLNA